MGLYASYLFPCKDMLKTGADSVDIAITFEPANKVVATGALVIHTCGRWKDPVICHDGASPTDITFVVDRTRVSTSSIYPQSAIH
jgi:hypothetical protein